MGSQSQWHHSSVQRDKVQVNILNFNKHENCEGSRNLIVYPVENICPTLHSDALENCQHGEENVVEVCDAAVGAFPFAPALSPIPPAKAPVPGKCTR